MKKRKSLFGQSISDDDSTVTGTVFVETLWRQWKTPLWLELGQHGDFAGRIHGTHFTHIHVKLNCLL